MDDATGARAGLAPFGVTAHDLRLAAACEHRILNAWPAADTLFVEGWAVRFAKGYSGRANSASAMIQDSNLNDETLDLIEQLYRDAGLPPCIRITPLSHDEVEAKLEARGYRSITRALGMVAELGGASPQPPALHIAAQADAAWVRNIAARKTGAKKDADAALTAIVSRIRLPAAFATVTLDGKPAAFGMGVAERGMAEIGCVMVDAAVRGRGLGRAAVKGLMGWARANGATQAYLQVERGNATAVGLYRSLGFREVYGYATMVRDV